MMAQSCYSPEEAVRVYVALEMSTNMRVMLIACRWERMAKVQKTTVPQLLSTHPTVRQDQPRMRQRESLCYAEREPHQANTSMVC